MQESTKKQYFETALKRNLDELCRAQLFWLALEGLERVESYHAIDFIRLSHWALYNQMIAHVIKVFVSNKKDAGFKYLYEFDNETSERLTNQLNFKLDTIKKIEPGLKKIRNKTHFHLDHRGIQVPRKVWESAGIKWNDLETAVAAGFNYLCAMHKEVFGKEYELPYYDGEDSKRIAEHAYEHRLLSPGSPPNPELEKLFSDD